MKNNPNANNKNGQLNNNKHRPENKDNLDSRMNEEQQTKGGDVTHNKKEHRKPENKSKK